MVEGTVLAECPLPCPGHCPRRALGVDTVLYLYLTCSAKHDNDGFPTESLYTYV